MCGITAIFAYGDRAVPVDRDELKKIQTRLHSRGPDGRGDWISSDGRIGLAHTRLAIIDLSEDAAQPMWTNDRKIGIVYNGEIYNFRELRAQLEKTGIEFRTSSDTEVLLELYRERGEQMVDDLRGMFAFVIVDLRGETELFLARDPFGIKPLYYSDDGSTLRLASQVKALIAGGGVSTTPDPAGAVGFFLLGSVPEPFTTHEAIRALPAGSTMRVTPRGPSEPKRYVTVPRLFAQSQQFPSTITLGEALFASVRHHLVSDVPVGAFLSAGIDSSVVASLAAEQGRIGARIESLTLAFEEYRGTADDESLLAAETAKRLGIDHHVRMVTRGEFHSDLDRFLDAMDQPTIDGVNTWFVTKAAAERGWKVALSGLGGDELFGGYPSFAQVPRLMRAARFWRRVPLARSVARTIAPRFVPGKPKLAGLLEYGPTIAGAWFLRRALFLPEELPEILGDDVAREGLARLDLLHHIGTELEHAEELSDRDRIAVLEAGLYMRNQLLRDTDWSSMAHSVEVRVPFVDPVLWSQIGVKHYDKQALAQVAGQALPSGIASRPKTGFTVPQAAWLEESPRGRGEPSRGLTMRHWAREVWARR